jgi:HAD superfamily hydrolase (TIGR01509 family)
MSMAVAPETLAALVRGVDLLCLDAGNTVVFLDHARLATLCTRLGFATEARALTLADGEMKLALERGEEHKVAWSQGHRAEARGWGNTMATILARAGAPPGGIARLLDGLWPDHCALNLWSLVPEGLAAALDRARTAGVRVAVVSNSEGMLERLFEQVGLVRAVDLIIDSGIVGIEKPDPRIFRIALERFGVAPERALHLGDTYATDVVGARAAGVRVALVDPHGHLRGRHVDVPRVAGAAEVARALVGARAAANGPREP